MTIQPIGIGLTGTELTGLERSLLKDSRPFSVVLFARNIASEAQLHDLVADIKGTASPSPLLMIDEEGDRVDRLRGLFPGIPGPVDASRSSDPELFARQMGEAIGRLLRHFEIDVNLAPVVDIEQVAPTKGLERRCWGADAPTVSSLAGTFMTAQMGEGVGACLKHFPGIGRGSADPHHGASVVTAGRDEILATDFAPYRALARIARCVMIGHCIYTEIDPDRPATLSSEISTGLLRKELEFDGLAVSDDMAMHAVSDLGSYEETCEAAIRAGSDVVLICQDVERMARLVEHFDRVSSSDPEFAARMEQARERAEAYASHVRDLVARAERPGIDPALAALSKVRREEPA